MVHNINFDIEQALALLRQFPSNGQNDAVIVDVIRKTLQSTSIDLDKVLEGAGRKQDEITNEIVRIQSEIASVHQRIEEMTSVVRDLQDQLGEIGSLRERFEG